MNITTSNAAGIDFVPRSAAALREALRIAQWNHAAVRAVSVLGTLVATELKEAMSALHTSVQGPAGAAPPKPARS